MTLMTLDRPLAPSGRAKTDRVLIVDDEPAMLDLLDQIVGRMGFETRLATNAEDALAHLADERGFEVLLADQSLPGGPCGHELIAAVRERWPMLQCVLISGGGPVPDCVDIPFLSKPFQLQKMRRLLKVAALRTKAVRAAWGG